MTVAVVGGVLVGFASIVDDGETVEIEDLFVDPGRMRQGIASALIEAVLTSAREGKRRRLRVDSNGNAIEFYRSVDFTVDSRVRLEHGSAIRMHREVLD